MSMMPGSSEFLSKANVTCSVNVLHVGGESLGIKGSWRENSIL